MQYNVQAVERKDKIMIKQTTLATFLSVLFIFIVSINLTSVVHAPVVTEWDVVLTATKEGYRDASEFGVRSDATDGFDAAYDELDPPEPPIGVVSYFWYPDNPTTPVNLQKLSKSKIAPSQHINWTYEVKPANIDGILLINWTAEDIASIPLEYSVHLLNSTEQVVADMREVTEYSFTAESGTTYTFAIKLESITPPPIIESCDSTGAKKDVFDLGEKVYANGSGYAPNTIYHIKIFEDISTPWTDGNPPAGIEKATITVTSDLSGNIPIKQVSPSLEPWEPGNYDIWVDVNGNTVYNADTDALDDCDIDTAGFLIIPEYLIGAILGLAGCFAAFGLFRLTKRKHP